MIATHRRRADALPPATVPTGNTRSSQANVGLLEVRISGHSAHTPLSHTRRTLPHPSSHHALHLSTPYTLPSTYTLTTLNSFLRLHFPIPYHTQHSLTPHPSTFNTPSPTSSHTLLQPVPLPPSLSLNHLRGVSRDKKVAVESAPPRRSVLLIS